MKTAMQEVQEAFKTYQDVDFFNWYMDNRVHLLEKEKQQIIEAFNEGYRSGETETLIANIKDVSEFDDAINYYSETFS